MRTSSLLVTLFILIYSHSFAQITITESDIADGGQHFIISTADPLDEYDITTTGASATWDFSYLSFVLQDTIDWLDATDTNPAYFILWFSADVAEQFTDGITTDTFSISDIYNFYDRSSDKLKQTGIAGSISGIPLPALFDEPDIVYDFPLAFGNEDSSVSNYTFDLLGLGSFSEIRHRKNMVDGWGTIETPFGSFDVIRLHSVIETEDILEYSGTEFPVEYTNHEYKWMAKEMGVPVLQINTSVVAGFETPTRIAYQDTAHVIVSLDQQNTFTGALHIFPDPVRDILHTEIILPSASTCYYELADVAGHTIYRSASENMLAGEHIINKNMSDVNITPGMYFMKLYVNGKGVVSKSFFYLP